MGYPEYLKDPDATLDFGIDWSDWLASGETISTSVWTVEAGIMEESNSHTDDVATIWLSGGTAGNTYTLTNRITTSGGRTDDRSILIKVEER